MTSENPRLFLFMPYIPFPVDRGTYQRVFHLFVELSKAFRIDLVCLQEDPERSIETLAPYTERRMSIPFQNAPWKKLFPDRLLNPLPATVAHWQVDGVSEALHGFVRGRNYDRVMFIDLVLWPYVRELFPDHPRRIMDRSRVDWLFQEEELNALQLSLRERFLRWENLRKIARLERQAYGDLRSTIVCGLDDRDFLATKLGRAENVFVLPNGYNAEFFNIKAFPRKPTEQATILFCGALDYSPNVDALDWFVQSIWPIVRKSRPEALWRIIGKSPDARSQRWAGLPGVELIGEVPDVRPYYQTSWLQVVPLRIGGGTRLKIVESLGMGCPVVSTPLGAQGLDLQPGRDLELADTAAAFAESVLMLLGDRETREARAESGLQTVRQNYRWEQLGAKLNQHLLAL